MRFIPETRSLRAALFTLFTSAAALWGLGIAGIWWRPVQRAAALVDNAASTCTILAGVCVVAWVVRDRDKELLLKSMAEDLSRRGGRGKPPTGPLRLVEDRSASA